VEEEVGGGGSGAGSGQLGSLAVVDSPSLPRVRSRAVVGGGRTDWRLAVAAGGSSSQSAKGQRRAGCYLHLLVLESAARRFQFKRWAGGGPAPPDHAIHPSTLVFGSGWSRYQLLATAPECWAATAPEMLGLSAYEFEWC